MTKQLVRWKTFEAKNIRGANFQSNLPNLLDLIYRGTLLSRILTMPRKKPISFIEGMLLFHEEMLKRVNDPEPDRCNWLYENCLEWISQQDYHIEINGDEFDPLNLTDKLY